MPTQTYLVFNLNTGQYVPTKAVSRENALRKAFKALWPDKPLPPLFGARYSLNLGDLAVMRDRRGFV